jgi:hypothetical protein
MASVTPRAAAGIVEGTEGDDALTGSMTADFMRGFGGEDLLHGLAGDDTLFGGAGDDVIFGDRGRDDMFHIDIGPQGAPEPGADEFRGGYGNDSILAVGEDRAFGGGQDDGIGIGGNTPLDDDATVGPLVHGGYGDDVIAALYLAGEFNENAPESPAPPPTAYGDGGDDTFVLSGGSGRFLGGAGADLFLVNDDQPHRPRPALLHGGRGADTFSLSSSTLGGPRLNGWAGDDTFETANGSPETIVCGTGTDTVLADVADTYAASCETVTVVPARAARR